MKIKVICRYCGHKFDDWVYDKSALQSVRCKVESCKDRNLEIELVDEKTGDVFGYNYKDPNG